MTTAGRIQDRDRSSVPVRSALGTTLHPARKDLRTDMRVDTRTYTRIEMRIDMRIDMRVEMRVGKCMGTFADFLATAQWLHSDCMTVTVPRHGLYVHR